MLILNEKTHQLLLLPKYNKTQVNSLLNVSMLFLFTFISTLTNIGEIGYFYNHVNKKGYFYIHENLIYIWHSTISKIVHPLLSKDMKYPMQINRDK